MNGLVASFANHTVTISRPTSSRDATGFDVPSYASVATLFPCRIHELTGNEALRYGRQVGQRVFIGSFEPGADLTPKDRVVWSGGTLEVKAVRRVYFTDSIGTESHVEAELEIKDL